MRLRCTLADSGTVAIRCSAVASATWSASRIGGRNLYPTKARPEQKIDAAVALIMAIGRAMAEPVLPTRTFENLAWDTMEDDWRQVRGA